MRVYLYFIGKPRDAHLNAFAGEFIKRASRYAACEMREIHPQRFDWTGRHAAALKVLLDPAGKPMDSGAFTQLIAKLEREGRDLVLLVGGAEGHSPEARARADLLLSLSPMTFPHELARAMAAEQIYRAFTTLRGHPYPR